MQSYANMEEESPKSAYYMPAQADRWEAPHKAMSILSTYTSGCHGMLVKAFSHS